jgi:hypothetical protein
MSHFSSRILWVAVTKNTREASLCSNLNGRLAPPEEETAAAFERKVDIGAR